MRLPIVVIRVLSKDYHAQVSVRAGAQRIENVVFRRKYGVSRPFAVNELGKALKRRSLNCGAQNAMPVVGQVYEHAFIIAQGGIYAINPIVAGLRGGPKMARPAR